MAKTEARQTGLTFEKVWTMFQETDKKFQKMSQEADKRQQETDRQMREMDKKIKELSENIGGVNNSLGDMAERLEAFDLYETFAALGLDFDQFTGNYELKERKTRRTLAEADMLLLNRTIAMVVEAKTTMKAGDVDKHIKRMEILRNKSNSLFANQKLYGAMAGVKMSKKARQYAIDKGFFVIELWEQSSHGNAIKIDIPEGFTPKTW
jgi:DNA-binding transcriptional MerR regulator